MPRGYCHRHGAPHSVCGCGRGRLSRLVEPAVLYLIAAGKAHHGYDLAALANELDLTDSTIDAAAVYRVLRDLEDQGCVASTWDVASTGPARRVYQITDAGRERLARWVSYIDRWSRHMQQFVALCRASFPDTDNEPFP